MFIVLFVLYHNKILDNILYGALLPVVDLLGVRIYIDYSDYCFVWYPVISDNFVVITYYYCIPTKCRTRTYFLVVTCNDCFLP